MNIVTEISLYIFIRIGRLHHIDCCQQTCLLVYRITIHYDILDNRTQFLVTTRFQPSTDLTIIKISNSHLFVIQQQRNKFMDVICHQIPVRIDNETLIFKEWRGEIHFWTTTFKPLFNFIISPTVHGINHCQTLHDHTHTLRQFLDVRNSAFVLLAHHNTLI